MTVGEGAPRDRDGTPNKQRKTPSKSVSGQGESDQISGSEGSSFSEVDDDLFAEQQLPDEELEKYGEYIESVRPTDIP